VYEYAKRLGFENKKSYAQTKKAVKTYLNKQLSAQDETRLEGISGIFVEKIITQVNGNPMFEVDGNLYKPTGYSVSPTMMTQEDRNTVLTNAVISEIAKQVFNNSLLLTPYNVSQIINKVIIESGFDTEVGIDNRSLQFIAETILALKSDLDAKGFAYKFNDEVVTSKLSEDEGRGYEGIATTPILTVVDNEGSVHLVDFKSFSGSYEASATGWSNDLTEIQAIFQDNGITIASINVVPIRVYNNYTTENGLTNLNLEKKSFNYIANNDNTISRTLLQLTTSDPVLTTLEEEGLLTQEEVESFDEIPLDEEDTPATTADNLKEDSLVVLESDIPIQEAEVTVIQPEIEATEEDMKVEDKNKATKTTSKKAMKEDTQVFMAGLGKGLYIQVDDHKGAFYTIKIFGDNVLANKYGKKRMTLEDLKAVYKFNNWLMPKSFEGKGTYQVLNADTQTPVLSKNYIEFVQPNGFVEVVNDVAVAADIIGTEVEIVENNEMRYNDTDEVQKDFKNKASLSIVNANGEKIGMVAPNSPLRETLKISNKKGFNRLQPTKARIKDIQFNDFNRAPLQSFADWEKNAIASGVLVPGEYEMVYVGVEDKQRVFKNQNGVVVPGKVPTNAPLGASYLFMTNFPNKNIIIPMVTPKLSELGYSSQDLKAVLDLIDRNKLTANNVDGVDIYPNFIAELDALVKNNKLKNPKLVNLQYLLSSELGGRKLDLRASSTQSQIDKLDSILPYTDGNQDLNDGILISFLLDRIITMNEDTLGSHKIGVNPNILFADNALVLDNVKSKPVPKKQVLLSAVAKNKNTDLVKDTYYESFLTETEDGENYVFFHKSNAPAEEINAGIDSRSFNSLRTSREEKATQYGVASYYTLPTDGERMVGGTVYTVKVPKKQVYPMNTDPNGYRSMAETIIPENTPFREANIKKEMVKMAAEDGYKMAVGNWYYDPSGNPITGPAMRADAIVVLVPETLTYKKATDKEIDHPLKEIIIAMNSLVEIAQEFENARNEVQDYSEGYSVAQNLRVYRKLPTNDQFEKMVANLPEKVQGKVEEARNLISMLSTPEEESFSGVASEFMSGVVGRLKETGLANEVFEMSNAEIEEKLVEFGADNVTFTTAGFVYNGDVYLNMDNMNLDTPIHEFGHLWLSWAKNNLGEAYARGLELAKSSEAEPYRQYVMETQPDLKVDSVAFLEEVLAQTIGDNGAKLVQENSTKTKSWLQELWNAIGQILGLSQYTAEQIQAMDLNQFSRAIATDLFKGSPIEALYANQIYGDDKVKVEVVYIEEGKKQELIEQGLLKETDNLNHLEGGVFVTTSPDDMLVGNVSILNVDGEKISSSISTEGNGGLFYVTKYGNVWAYSNLNRANAAIKSINESLLKNGGKTHLVLTKGSDAKLLSNPQGVTSTLKVAEALLDAELISRQDMRRSVIDALKSYDITLDIPLTASVTQIKDALDANFSDVNASSFEKRGNVLKSILGNMAKKESFKGNLEQIANFLNTNVKNVSKVDDFINTIALVSAEKFTKGLSGSDIYASIEITNPVKIDESKDHSTFGYGLIMVDENNKKIKPVLTLISGKYSAFDILDEQGRSIDEIEGNRAKQELLFRSTVTGTSNTGLGKGRLSKEGQENKLVQKSVVVAPGNRLFNNPLLDATTIANKYNEENGLAPMVDNTITKIDKPFAIRLSKAYDDMVATPFEEETQEAYKALVEETIAQHRAILAEGYRVEMSTSEYDNAQEMIDDLRENKRMKIFSTEAGFGDNPITEEQRKENPLLQVTEFKDANNVPLLANDVFRFVHDFFGHAKLGNGFGPVGEENAWRVHVQMYSPMARKAITSETRGQNSFVNFSGINDEAFKVRDEARKLRKEGKLAEAKVLSDQVYKMMKFADQKVGILPEWAYKIPSENLEDTTSIPDCV